LLALSEYIVTYLHPLSLSLSLSPFHCLFFFYTHTHIHTQPLKSTDLADIVPKWDADFVNIEQETLFELILAANYMDIKSLLDLTCAKVASMIKGKTPEQIRQTFNIRKDFTEEEEKQIIDENKWCEGAFSLR
jgi:hypothetical protein